MNGGDAFANHPVLHKYLPKCTPQLRIIPTFQLHMLASSSHRRSASRNFLAFPSHETFNAALASTARSSQSTLSSSIGSFSAFSTTFQPFAGPSSLGNEDRHVIERWRLPSGEWTFAAVFDGHAGHETVDYAASSLPPMIRNYVGAACSSPPLNQAAVSDSLANAIRSFDTSLANDLRAVLPDDFENVDDAQLRTVINDQSTGGRNYSKVVRCMRGCTVLVALVDPSRRHVWVANLGDGQAVLGEQSENGLVTAPLSSAHNGNNPFEVRRIRAEHPGEFQAVTNGRVLGALTTTRALGDHAFKLPAVYTHKVFLNARPGFRAPSRVRDFASLIQTPPYVSSTPEVVHRTLPSTADTGSTFALVIASDGLTDLFEGRGNFGEVTRRWAEVALNGGDGEYLESGEGLQGNRALWLLKDALGDTLEKQSMMLTMERNEAWMDDTTIVVLVWS